MTRELTWQQKLNDFKVRQEILSNVARETEQEVRLRNQLSLLEEIFTDRLNGLEQELKSLQGLVHKLEEKI